MDKENFEIFQEFCSAKVNLATEFLIDNIFVNLGLHIPLESKYQNIQKFLLDFMVITENLLNLSIKFLQFENLELENFIKFFRNDFPLETSDEFLEYLHSFILSNYDKLTLLKNKKIGLNDPNQLVDYILNFQTTFSHQNFGYLDGDVKLLLKLIKNKNDNNLNKNLFEIDEINLADVIRKLKEVYDKIKV